MAVKPDHPVDTGYLDKVGDAYIPPGYTDYMSILSQKTPIGYSYMDFDKLIDYYNISRLPDYDNAAEPYIAYILMSRPGLNVPGPGGTTGYDNSGNGLNYASANMTQLKQHGMTAAFANDKYGDKILRSLSRYNTSHPWLPMITTRAMSYSVSDMEIKTIEKGNTYYGHVLKYGKHSEDHKISATVSIDFRNDRFLSILKMMHLWMSYIYLVSKSSCINPAMEDQQNAVLDYCGSIYYLVTRRDGRELVYWEKLVGTFPIKSPLSIFSFNDNMIINDTVGIEFAYGMKCDPCDPSILMDINVLSGKSFYSIGSTANVGSNGKIGTTQEVKMDANHGVEMYHTMGDVLATNPYIQIKKDYQGTLKYYLIWEKR